MSARGEFYDYRDKDGMGRVYAVHRRSIHPAMRVCKEWGSLLLNEEVKVVCEDQRATDWINAFLSSNERMAHGVEGMFDDLAASDGPTGGPDVVRRIVFDQHDLRGKAIALEHRLDDRAIELLKVALMGMAKQQGAVPMDDDTSVVSLVGIEDGDLVFELEYGEDSMTAAMPRGGYDLYADAIMRSSLAKEQPYYVNRTCAHHAIEVLDDERVL